RRRHTRSDRDWSSDVCSSDLVLFVEVAVTESEGAWSCAPVSLPALVEPARLVWMYCAAPETPPTLTPEVVTVGVDVEVARKVARSEERRVGKEGRYRGGR